MNYPNLKGDKLMKLSFFRFTFFLLVCFSLPLTATAQVVDIPDPNLRAAINRQLGKADGAVITSEEMNKLHTLDRRSMGIIDLTGLEYATNLRSLFLWNNPTPDLSPIAGLTQLHSIGLGGNSVSDLSPLVGLTNLRNLYLPNNSVTDLSPLVGLINLRTLDLQNNSITDITPLRGLFNLRQLYLNGNSVTDLSPLAGLTNLRDLYLGGNSVTDLSPLVGLANLSNLHLNGNSVTDITPLRGLFNLYALDLQDNSISDLTPLIENRGIGTGDWIAVAGNPLNDESINILPTLRERGVRVDNTTIIFSLNPIPDETAFVAVGETFTIDLIVKNVFELAGWQIRHLDFNPSVLSVTSVEPSNVLKTGGKEAYNVEGTIDNNAGRVSGFSSVRLSTGGVSGTGILFSITFEAKAAGDSRFWRTELDLTNVKQQNMRWTMRAGQVRVQNYDVNGDGNVTLDDLVLVGQNLGTNNSQVDVTGNGWIDIVDLVAIAGYLGKSTTSKAPSAEYVPDLNSMMIQKWIDMAREADDGSLTFHEGITTLELLLASLVPDETALLANYPNPFNPETWIPYRLAEDAFVTLTIYDGSGQVVRTLDMGHQSAAVYESQSKAIYWDGRNNLGETVASGVYFYTLTAGDYSATRKMLILK